MPLSNKRKASTGDNDGPSPKRKAGNHITRRATSSSLPQPLEKLDEDIEPVASQSSAGSEYAARDILQENATKYLIDWEDNPVTGERYNPTWELKSFANAALVRDWRERKKEKALAKAVTKTAAKTPAKKTAVKGQAATANQAKQRERRSKRLSSATTDEQNLQSLTETERPAKVLTKARFGKSRIINSSAESATAGDRHNNKKNKSLTSGANTNGTIASLSPSNHHSGLSSERKFEPSAAKRLEGFIVSVDSNSGQDTYIPSTFPQSEQSPSQQVSSSQKEIDQSQLEDTDPIESASSQVVPARSIAKRVIPDSQSQEITDTSLSTIPGAHDLIGFSSSAPQPKVAQEEGLTAEASAKPGSSSAPLIEQTEELVVQQQAHTSEGDLSYARRQESAKGLGLEAHLESKGRNEAIQATVLEDCPEGAEGFIQQTVSGQLEEAPKATATARVEDINQQATTGELNEDVEEPVTEYPGDFIEDTFADETESDILERILDQEEDLAHKIATEEAEKLARSPTNVQLVTAEPEAGVEEVSPGQSGNATQKAATQDCESILEDLVIKLPDNTIVSLVSPEKSGEAHVIVEEANEKGSISLSISREEEITQGIPEEPSGEAPEYIQQEEETHSVTTSVQLVITSPETTAGTTLEKVFAYPTQADLEIVEVVQSSVPETTPAQLPFDADERIQASVLFPQQALPPSTESLDGAKLIDSSSEIHIFFETQVPFNYSRVSFHSPPPTKPELLAITEKTGEPQTHIVGLAVDVSEANLEGEVAGTIKATTVEDRTEGQSFLQSHTSAQPTQSGIPEQITLEVSSQYLANQISGGITRYDTPGKQADDERRSPSTAPELTPTTPFRESFGHRQPEFNHQISPDLSIHTQDLPLIDGDPLPKFSFSSSLPQLPSQFPDETLSSNAPPRPESLSTMSDWTNTLPPVGGNSSPRRMTLSERKIKHTAELAAERAGTSQPNRNGRATPNSRFRSSGSKPPLGRRMINSTLGTESPPPSSGDLHSTENILPSKSVSSNGDTSAFSLPIQLFNPAGLMYRNKFRRPREQELIDRFLNSKFLVQDDDTMAKIEEFLQTILNITTHSDLLSDTTWTQVETNPKDQANYDTDVSSKFAFLRAFFKDPRVQVLEKHVVMFVRPGQIIDMVETFLKGIDVTYERPDRSQRYRGASSSLQVTLMPTGLSEEDDRFHAVAVMSSADIVIGLDESFDVNEDIVKQVRQNALDSNVLCPAVVPVTVYTLEHIMATMKLTGTRYAKLRELLSRSSQLMLEAGKAPTTVPKPHELGRLVADCFSSILEWEKLPSLASIELPKFNDSQSSDDSEPGLKAARPDKRPADTDDSSDSSHIAKKPRWATSSMANIRGFQPSNAAPTSSTISETPNTSDKLFREALAREQLLLDDNRKLKEIAASSQAILNTVTEQNEALNHELALSRAALTTAQSAIINGETRSTTLNNTIAKLKGESRALRDKLSAARSTLAGSTLPNVAALEAGRAHGQRVAELEARLASLANDADFLRTQYQTASNFARDLAADKDALRAENTALAARATTEAASLRRMFADTALRTAHAELDRLAARDAASARLLEKLVLENAALKVRPGMTMTTRASSVPRRAAGAGAAGGSRAGSRQGSPLPVALGAAGRVEKEKGLGKGSHLRQ